MCEGVVIDCYCLRPGLVEEEDISGVGGLENGSNRGNALLCCFVSGGIGEGCSTAATLVKPGRNSRADDRF